MFALMVFWAFGALPPTTCGPGRAIGPVRHPISLQNGKPCFGLSDLPLLQLPPLSR